MKKIFFKNIKEKKLRWSISTLCRGDSDIIELFIMWYYPKVKYLNIGLHNPSQRILNMINDIKVKNMISNLKIFIFQSEIYQQTKWVNEIYRETVININNVDIYAHVDIDEFIYRFDLIEENFEPNAIIKFEWVNVIRDKVDWELSWSYRDSFKEIPESEITQWGKTLYCIGKDFKNIEYQGGQHNIVINGVDDDSRNIINLKNPIFYHFPYRNEIQAYNKISTLIDNFTERKLHVNKTWGRHVLLHFLNKYSPNYSEIFDSEAKENFVLNIDENSLKKFANQYKDLPKEKLFPINETFFNDFFSKYYNEKNSLLDFIEEDFVVKMKNYRHFYNEAEPGD